MTPASSKMRKLYIKPLGDPSAMIDTNLARIPEAIMKRKSLLNFYHENILRKNNGEYSEAKFYRPEKPVLAKHVSACITIFVGFSILL
jgi:hypothetical protein